MPRMTSARMMPTSSAVCWYCRGTANLRHDDHEDEEVVDAQAVLREPARRRTRRRSGRPAKSPGRPARRAIASPTKKLIAIAHSRIVGSCGRRPMTNTSTASRPTSRVMLAIQSQVGTFTGGQSSGSASTAGGLFRPASARHRRTDRAGSRHCSASDRDDDEAAKEYSPPRVGGQSYPLPRPGAHRPRRPPAPRGVTTRRTRCPPGRPSRPSARPSRRTPARWVAPSPSSRSTSARHHSRAAPSASSAGTDLDVEVHPVLHRLGLGHLLDEDPRTLRRPGRRPPTAIVPLVLGHTELAQERRPRVVARRRRLDHVAERPPPRTRPPLPGRRRRGRPARCVATYVLLGCQARAGRAHAAQLLLQLADLVAQPGGELELQLARPRRASGRSAAG